MHGYEKCMELLSLRNWKSGVKGRVTSDATATENLSVRHLVAMYLHALIATSPKTGKKMRNAVKLDLYGCARWHFNALYV